MNVLKKLSPLMMAFAVIFALASCQSDANDARAKARESLATATPVTPNSNADKATTPKPAAIAEVPAGPTTVLEYDETTFDFGTVPEGDKVTHIYKFKNTGKEPLVISNAKGSCGCTVPQWPKDPIAPGESGEILVEFNSKGKPGKQTKRVTVTANTNPTQSFLTITGQVDKKEVG